MVGKPEGKRPLGRPRYTWEDIKMDLKESVGGFVLWLRIRVGGGLLSHFMIIY
jgi:hypothetical protein